ncbi:hypothetical protein ACFXGA_20230 [Actinosynnema sp. NPDC059335]|uniref:hypothetical protein n=1 Tax=Actinosynnema sp. NPDC059335 TaxID=3346804 RepID=UPI00366B0BF4
MNETRYRRKRAVVVVTAAVVLAAGVLVCVLVDLDTADRLASVAALFVAVTGLALTLLHRMAPAPANTGHTPAPDTAARPRTGGTSAITINQSGGGVVQTGEGAHAEVHQEIRLGHPGGPSRRTRRRNA